MSRPELCAQCVDLENDPDEDVSCAEHVLDCRRLAAVYDDGVARERERCAKLCDRLADAAKTKAAYNAGRDLAELIRSGEAAP